MSQAVKAALLTTKDLGKNERALAIAIAAHANNEGNAWPSVATLAEYVGCSERTVQRCLAKLVQLGRLVVSKVAGIATRVYRLVHTDRRTTAAVGVTEQPAGVTDSPAGGDSQSVTRSTEDQFKGDAPVSAAGWRRFLPTSRRGPALAGTDRRGAATPNAGGRCQRPGHVGQPIGRCVPCRSEAIERR
ncbi:helix-turn-helix domain-containing protein [Micromonospora sp. NPDC005707]|uniref:helix-turn-helix domain-containing protein n=1 Tax=Micromonospora sp. NPDC005707 TaxID=3157050 RepID=UPI0033F8CB61